MKQLTTKYDNLFEVSFPYSMGWHGKPGIQIQMLYLHDNGTVSQEYKFKCFIYMTMLL